MVVQNRTKAQIVTKTTTKINIVFNLLFHSLYIPQPFPERKNIQIHHDGLSLQNLVLWGRERKQITKLINFKSKYNNKK